MKPDDIRGLLRPKTVGPSGPVAGKPESKVGRHQPPLRLLKGTLAQFSADVSSR
jgi:hypothetical protein